MTKRGRWPGTWAAICHRCGIRYPSDQLVLDWQGLRVCRADYETRHPQEFVRGRIDKQAPAWTSPELTPVFIPFCSLAGKSAYAGFAKAGCFIAGNTQYTPSFLFDVNKDEYGLTSIAQAPSAATSDLYVDEDYWIDGYTTEEDNLYIFTDYVVADYFSEE